MQRRITVPVGGHIQWHITSVCPNRCIHCYMYGADATKVSRNDLSIAQINVAYDKICEFENRTGYRFNSFSITGGDPLYQDKGWFLIERLHKDNRAINILGIPEQINEINIQKMKQFQVSTYQVSLDGLEETHDQIRGKESFIRTIEGIKTLNAQGIRCHVMFTVNNINQDELFPLIEYLEDQKVDVGFSFDFMIGPVDSAFQERPRMLKKKEAKKIILEYHRWQKIRSTYPSTVRLLDKTMLNEVLSAKDRGYKSGEIWFGGCGIGEGLCILENGDIFPCRRLPISLGNIINDSLETVFFSSDILNMFRERVNWTGCGDCDHFDICRGCPAVTYAFTGDPFEEMPYCFLKVSNDNQKSLYELQGATRSEKTYLYFKKMDMLQLWETAKKQNITRNLWMKESLDNKN